MATTAAEIGTRTVWNIDPAHTQVAFSAKHMMVTTVRGQFNSVTGTVVADESNHANSSIEVDIDAASIDTRNEQRDTHLRSADFLEAEKFPKITFRSSGVDVLAEDHMKVHGDLTVHGVTHPITLEATVNGRGKSPYGMEVAGVTLEGSLSRKEFGLNWNVALETGGVLVGDKLKIDIEVELVKQS